MEKSNQKEQQKMMQTKEVVVKTEIERERDRQSARWFQLLGLPSLLYAIFFTVCLYENLAGILVPIWTAGTLVYVGYLLRKTRITWTWSGWLYLAGMEILGISCVLTENSYILLLNYLVFFSLLFVFLLQTTKKSIQWRFGVVICELFVTVMGAIVTITTPFREVWALWREQRGSERQIDQVMKGILIAVPFLIVIGACLTSADAVFSSIIHRLFWKLVIPEHWLSIGFMVLLGFFSAYCGMHYFLANRVQKQRPAKESRNALPAVTFLLAILCLYVWFCAIQIIYLFAGFGTLPQGMTYAGYARTGFFQLLFVCIANLVLVLVVKGRYTESRILNIALLAICLCSYIMTASSMYRMLLYIQVYQLTFLRVLVMTALVTICVLLAGVMYTVVKPSFPVFHYTLIVVTAVYLLFSLSHVDYFIARYNLSVHGEAAEDTMEYLSTLSTDAAPAIVDYLEEQGIGAETIQKKLEKTDLGEETWYESYLLYNQKQLQETSVRKWNLSIWMANRCFEK